MSTHNFGIAIHGGAGTILKSEMTPEKENNYKAALEKALQAGYDCLENGKTAYVTFLEENQVAWGSTEYIVIRPHDSLHPFFGYVLARNQVFREYAEGCMAGSSGRQRVDINHLKKFDIGVASNDAIKQFNELAEVVAPKLHANMMQINTLKKLRGSLLPKLISGEVRVQL